jgi:hypothetical protein
LINNNARGTQTFSWVQRHSFSLIGDRTIARASTFKLYACPPEIYHARDFLFLLDKWTALQDIKTKQSHQTASQWEQGLLDSQPQSPKPAYPRKCQTIWWVLSHKFCAFCKFDSKVPRVSLDLDELKVQCRVFYSTNCKIKQQQIG